MAFHISNQALNDKSGGDSSVHGFVSADNQPVLSPKVAL
jgi:hypothetical protein